MSHYAQNVTLSSMSPLDNVTLLGETEGVTLSRVGLRIDCLRCLQLGRECLWFRMMCEVACRMRGLQLGSEGLCFRLMCEVACRLRVIWVRG